MCGANQTTPAALFVFLGAVSVVAGFAAHLYLNPPSARSGGAAMLPLPEIPPEVAECLAKPPPPDR